MSHGRERATPWRSCSSSAFDIPPPQSTRLVNRGFNDVYEIDGLYLRIGRNGRRSVADSEAEAVALSELAGAGVPVAPARHGRDGRFAQAIALAEGERSVLVRLPAHMPYGLTVRLCHGDCHGWNAAIEGGQATLFDFDECGIGPQAYDVATFLWGCTQVSPDQRLPLWPRFVAGYTSVRRLPAADLAALDLFFIVREVWFLGASAEGVAHWGDNWFKTSGIAPRIERVRERCENLVTPRLLA